jgi:hypothetical protein
VPFGSAYPRRNATSSMVRGETSSAAATRSSEGLPSRRNEEDHVIAVAVHARGRNEPGETLEELEGREHELATTLRVRLGGSASSAPT